MSIPFTQFKRPDGRQVPVTIERPADIEAKATALLDAGFRFEIEHLMTGDISMTVSRGGEDHVGRLCANGPNVPLNVDAMIVEAYETLLKETPL